MLKKLATFVLASFRSSTYPKGTPRTFTRCGLADELFEHPVGSIPVVLDVQTIEIPAYTQSLSAACI
jgi:hypothetical protein